MVATTSFAIVFNVVIQFLNQLSSFNLPIFQLDRSRPAENADRDTQFSAVRINLFHHAALVLEGAIRHLYRLSHLKTNFWLNLVFKLPDLRQHTFDLLRPHRDRPIFGPGETEYSRCFANEVPSPFNQLIL